MLPGVHASDGADGPRNRRLRASPPTNSFSPIIATAISRAFAKLVGRYQRELYHFLVRFLGNRASAEEFSRKLFFRCISLPSSLIPSGDSGRGFSPSPPIRLAI